MSISTPSSLCAFMAPIQRQLCKTTAPQHHYQQPPKGMNCTYSKLKTFSRNLIIFLLSHLKHALYLTSLQNSLGVIHLEHMEHYINPSCCWFYLKVRFYFLFSLLPVYTPWNIFCIAPDVASHSASSFVHVNLAASVLVSFSFTQRWKEMQCQKLIVKENGKMI